MARTTMLTQTEKRRLNCPNRAAHTNGPDGYIAWHDWAETMAQGHEQSQCPSCDLWLIWTPSRREGP